MSFARLRTSGAKVTGTFTTLDSTQDSSFSMRIKGSYFQTFGSGEIRTLALQRNTGNTQTIWTLRAPATTTPSAVDASVFQHHLQFRASNASGSGTQNAHQLSIDPLTFWEADEWYTIHWGCDGHTSGSNQWLRVVRDSTNTLIINQARTLGADIYTGTSQQIVINPTTGDDVGNGQGLIDTANSNIYIDGFAIWAPAHNLSVAADIVALPTDAEHSFYFEETSGGTVTAVIGAVNLAVAGTEGQDYAWLPKGPTWLFDDNALPADSEYITPDGTGTQTPGTGTGASTATPAVQNQRMEGHRNGTNPGGNMRINATTGLWDLSGAREFRAKMLLRGPSGFFTNALRNFIGPSAALRKFGDINNTYVNVGISRNGAGVIEASSVQQAASGDTPLSGAVTVGDPNDTTNPFDLEFLWRSDPNGSDWDISTFFRRIGVGASTAHDSHWRLLYTHTTAFTTANINALMIRLTTQNGSGGANLAFSGSEYHGWDTVNPGGVWTTSLSSSEDTLTDGLVFSDSHAEGFGAADTLTDGIQYSDSILLTVGVTENDEGIVYSDSIVATFVNTKPEDVLSEALMFIDSIVDTFTQPSVGAESSILVESFVYSDSMSAEFGAFGGVGTYAIVDYRIYKRKTNHVAHFDVSLRMANDRPLPIGDATSVVLKIYGPDGAEVASHPLNVISVQNAHLAARIELDGLQANKRHTAVIVITRPSRTEVVATNPMIVVAKEARV